MVGANWEMTDAKQSTVEIDTSQEVSINLHTNDKLEDFPSGVDQVTQTRDNVEIEIKRGVEVESPATSVSVTPKGPGEQQLAELRYANPHGTFITGVDVNSEVGRTSHCRTVHTTCRQRCPIGSQHLLQLFIISLVWSCTYLIGW